MNEPTTEKIQIKPSTCEGKLLNLLSRGLSRVWRRELREISLFGIFYLFTQVLDVAESEVGKSPLLKTFLKLSNNKLNRTSRPEQ